MSALRLTICLAAALCAQGQFSPNDLSNKSGTLADVLMDPSSGPGAYEEHEAQMFASLASVSYCHDESQITAWSCQACKDSETPMVEGKVRLIDAGVANASRMIIGKLKLQTGCALIFRGSSNIPNWIRDFQAWRDAPTEFKDCQGCSVHSGYLSIWNNVKDEVIAALNDVGCVKGSDDGLVYVTGHSLGAGMAHLAMFALDSAGFNIPKTYTFESPRVGNQAFADAFHNAFGRRYDVFRITHHYDPVVHVPPEMMGYRHVNTEVYYDGDGKYTICRDDEDSGCSNQFRNLPSMLINNVADHCNSPLVPNGDICDPVGCGNDAEARPPMV